MTMIKVLMREVADGKCYRDNTIVQKNPSYKTANLQGSGAQTHRSCDTVPYAINAAVYTRGRPPTVPRSVARLQARLALTSRPSSPTPPLLSLTQV